MSLFTMSKLNGLFEFLDSVEIDLLNKDIKEMIDQKYLNWGWNWDFPKVKEVRKRQF